VGSILEGAVRPGHFAGVLTVVLKLFGVVGPSVAVFGRKDAQQAFLVRRMAGDFNLPVRILVAPTMREADGLAMSSRNVYLDETMRRQASVLPRALEAGVQAFRNGARRAGDVVAATWKVLSTESGVTAEYINVVDAETFHPNHAATPSSYLVAALRVGSKRLIDNVVLGEGLEADPRRPAREHAPTS
jgi:pantoate--beta-alanine ligase